MTICRRIPMKDGWVRRQLGSRDSGRIEPGASLEKDFRLVTKTLQSVSHLGAAIGAAELVYLSPTANVPVALRRLWMVRRYLIERYKFAYLSSGRICCGNAPTCPWYVRVCAPDFDSGGRAAQRVASVGGCGSSRSAADRIAGRDRLLTSGAAAGTRSLECGMGKWSPLAAQRRSPRRAGDPRTERLRTFSVMPVVMRSRKC